MLRKIPKSLYEFSRNPNYRSALMLNVPGLILGSKIVPGEGFRGVEPKFDVSNSQIRRPEAEIRKKHSGTIIALFRVVIAAFRNHLMNVLRALVKIMHMSRLVCNYTISQTKSKKYRSCFLSSKTVQEKS